MMKIRPVVLLLVALLMAPAASGQTPDDRGFDPSGTRRGKLGTVPLMLGGKTLSYSYMAAFGFVGNLPSTSRKGYVVKGNVVEAVGIVSALRAAPTVAIP
jgi:hypothetical protein